MMKKNVCLFEFKLFLLLFLITVHYLCFNFRCSISFHHQTENHYHKRILLSLNLKISILAYTIKSLMFQKDRSFRFLIFSNSKSVPGLSVQQVFIIHLFFYRDLNSHRSNIFSLPNFSIVEFNTMSQDTFVKESMPIAIQNRLNHSSFGLYLLSIVYIHPSNVCYGRFNSSICKIYLFLTERIEKKNTEGIKYAVIYFTSIVYPRCVYQ
jgi:hypothetical protein